MTMGSEVRAAVKLSGTSGLGGSLTASFVDSVLPAEANEPSRPSTQHLHTEMLCGAAAIWKPLLAA